MSSSQRRAETERSGWALTAIASLSVLVAILIACSQDSMPTGFDSEPSASDGYVLGSTSSILFATTVAPPPSSDPDPTPTPAPVDDGTVRMNSIVLAVDQACPDCTVTTRRGKAVVTDDTNLLDAAEAKISFDEFNAGLKPGFPVHIIAKKDGGADPVANRAQLESSFATTGTIDVSSNELQSRRQFRLGFDSEVGYLEFDYELASDAVVESFAAGERVLVRGTVAGDVLKAGLVRKDK